MTHTATAHAVEYTGAKTIFADIDIESGNINIPSLRKSLKTKAIIIVHMAGRSCELREILKICKTYKIKLIEDWCLGTNTQKTCGQFWSIWCFLLPNKTNHNWRRWRFDYK